LNGAALKGARAAVVIVNVRRSKRRGCWFIVPPRRGNERDPSQERSCTPLGS
jgi:hypothetical protein